MFLCNSVSLCDGAYKDEESCYSMVFTTGLQRDTASAHVSECETLREETGL